MPSKANVGREIGRFLWVSDKQSHWALLYLAASIRELFSLCSMLTSRVDILRSAFVSFDELFFPPFLVSFYLPRNPLSVGHIFLLFFWSPVPFGCWPPSSSRLIPIYRQSFPSTISIETLVFLRTPQALYRLSSLSSVYLVLKLRNPSALLSYATPTFFVIVVSVFIFVRREPAT